MADLATFVERRGTAIVWGEASSTTVCGAYTTTKTLSLDALADGSARMGAYHDLGADAPPLLEVMASVETGTAPTAGNRVDVYLVFSNNTSNWPGGVSGSDGAWPSDGNEDEWAVQLGSPALSIIATNDGNTIQIQQPVIVKVKGRYVTVVYDNNLGQGVRNETTNSDNGSGVVAWPLSTVATG